MSAHYVCVVEGVLARHYAYQVVQFQQLTAFQPEPQPPVSGARVLRMARFPNAGAASAVAEALRDLLGEPVAKGNDFRGGNPRELTDALIALRSEHNGVLCASRAPK